MSSPWTHSCTRPADLFLDVAVPASASERKSPNAAVQAIDASYSGLVESSPGSSSAQHSNRWQAAAAAIAQSQQGLCSTSGPSTPSPKQAAAARLKSLQRTPLPLIIAQMKVLLERLHFLMDEGAAAAAASSTTGTFMRPSLGPRNSSSISGCNPWSSSSNKAAAPSSAGLLCGPRPATPPSIMTVGRYPGGCSSSGGSAVGSRASSAARKPARSMMEVSIGGGRAQNAMNSVESVLDELDATLGFVSSFLGQLSAETRRALAAVVRLESYKKDQVIYDINDHATHFFVILSGRIDIWSHPPGTHRPKSIVSILRRGEAFGDQAILSDEPHSTAASAASNTTLLVVAKEDFLTVLGSHFRGVTAMWQSFMSRNVAPLADADPSVVRRLCSNLVTSKPAAGKECGMHQGQIYFIKAGTFELQLIDLDAHRAAEAALAAAVASASSTISIAPLPAFVRSASCKRPSTAPAGINVTGRRPASPVAVAGMQTAKTFVHAGAYMAAASVSTATTPATALAVAAGSLPSEAAGGGLGRLQSSLTDLPTLGKEGVLSSVRVKGGRLIGTQGLERELRKAHNARVPYKVVATLGPGSWFGGGEAIYGSGVLQSSLRVVAIGRDNELVHTHLSGLEQHEGEALIKRLRDDAAFALTYYLGRLGVLPAGAAVGHAESSLMTSEGRLGPLELASTASSPRYMMARAASARPPLSSREQASVASTAASPAASRPATSMKATRERGSISSRVSSCPEDACSDPCSPPSARPASANAMQSSEDGCEAAAPAQPCVKPGTAGAASSSSAAASIARRQRHKRIHVPGSGVFSPGTMAALQHVQSLQAEAECSSFSHLKLHNTYSLAASEPQKATAASHAAADNKINAPTNSTSRPSSARANMLAQEATAAANTQRPAARSSILPGGSVSQMAERDGSPGPVAQDGAVTAADVYWQQPDNSSSTTGVALSDLLESVFKEGYMPLVNELDCIISHTSKKKGEGIFMQHLQQQHPHSQGYDTMSQPPDHFKQQGQHQWLWQQQKQQQHQTQKRALQRPQTAAGRLQGAAACGGEQPPVQEALQHRPSTSLLAASVMWQRGSKMAFRPPIRQCLTAAEIARQRHACQTGDERGLDALSSP